MRKRHPVALDQLPEVVHHPVAAIALRRRHHHLRPRDQAGHQDRIGGEDVEQRQRAHQHVRLGEHVELRRTSRCRGCRAPGAARPSACPWCRRCGRRRRPGRRASRRSRAPSAFSFAISRRRSSTRARCVGASFGRISGTIQASGGAEAAHQVDLQHRLDRRRQRHRLGHLLREVGLRERPQRHHHLGPGVAQDLGHMLDREQRVDRRDDPGRRPGEQHHRRLDRVRQHVGDGVGRPDPEPAEQVRRPRDLGLRLRPGQRQRACRAARTAAGR